MAYGCASCPQPGINLPDNWENDPDQYVVSSNVHGELCQILFRDVFTRFICVDGNFSADHLKQKNPLDDVSLTSGEGMMTNPTRYKRYLAQPISTPQVSRWLTSPRQLYPLAPPDEAPLPRAWLPRA